MHIAKVGNFWYVSSKDRVSEVLEFPCQARVYGKVRQGALRAATLAAIGELPRVLIGSTDKRVGILIVEEHIGVHEEGELAKGIGWQLV